MIIQRRTSMVMDGHSTIDNGEFSILMVPDSYKPAWQHEFDGHVDLFEKRELPSPIIIMLYPVYHKICTHLP